MITSTPFRITGQRRNYLFIFIYFFKHNNKNFIMKLKNTDYGAMEQCSESSPVQAIHNLGEVKLYAQANSEGNRELIWGYGGHAVLAQVYIYHQGTGGGITQHICKDNLLPDHKENAYINSSAHSHNRKRLQKKGTSTVDSKRHKIAIQISHRLIATSAIQQKLDVNRIVQI
jgi:hypothetical protein